MLWQPSLPDRYTKADPRELGREIAARRTELGDRLVILGHHYQSDEVIRHADFTGDSLKLSQTAARLAAERAGRVRWVVFCGVHFMAETADMLTPDEVEVILPDLSAGCSMADMAAYDDTVEAWEAIHASLADQGWKGRVVPITYVNSSAAIKAFVGTHGGSCCTSSNAERVFEWALAGAGDTSVLRSADASPPSSAATRAAATDIKVLFLPDQHLGRNTTAKRGIDTARRSAVYDPRRARKGEPLGGMTPEQLLDAQVILWAGHCSVHKLFRPEHCDEVRALDNAGGAGVSPARGATSAGGTPAPPTTILVHPECCKEVVDKADLAGSTEFIIKTIRGAPPGSRWAVGTEVHLVNRLATEAKARGVGVRILSDCQCLCTTMFRIDQPHLLWVLDHLTGRLGKDGKPRSVNVVRVHPEVRRDALLAVERMLQLAAAPGLAVVD
ncbi:MAG: quinolinate synthase [Phycisphaerales bacterium]